MRNEGLLAGLFVLVLMVGVAPVFAQGTNAVVPAVNAAVAGNAVGNEEMGTDDGYAMDDEEYYGMEDENAMVDENMLDEGYDEEGMDDELGNEEDFAELDESETLPVNGTAK